MTTDCKHERIQTWRFEDSTEVAGLWSCTDCGRRFEPVGAALAQTGAEPVACVTECEACFTPDACQLRGTCDHYAASKLRIAPTAQPAPLPAPANHPDLRQCALWTVDAYNSKRPDYLLRSIQKLTHALDAAPLPAREPLTDEQIDALQRAWIADGGSGPAGFARAIEAAHNITATPAAQEPGHV